MGFVRIDKFTKELEELRNCALFLRIEAIKALEKYEGIRTDGESLENILNNISVEKLWYEVDKIEGAAVAKKGDKEISKRSEKNFLEMKGLCLKEIGCLNNKMQRIAAIVEAASEGQR